MVSLFIRANQNNYIICLILFLVIYYLVQYHNHNKKPIDFLPRHVHKYVNTFKENAVNKHVNIKTEIENTRMVQNWQRYGPVSSTTTIIVVRVHRDVDRLQYLIVSLAFVHDIEKALLIFSHTFYDEDLNLLIQKIDFCMVLQIFYPQSLQLYPDLFFNDYANATLNDGGARQAETKNHWWWTAHVVFEQLAWAGVHEDMVIFINEDSYVLPDLLHMLRLSKLSLAYVPDADVISFGRSPALDLDYDKLSVEAWRPAHNIGLAFNRTTWRKIVAFNVHYCLYDDSSWSYSLQHLFNQFPERNIVMVACMAPRIVPTGVFLSGKQAFEMIWGSTKCDKLFPKKVQVVILYGQSGRLMKKYKMPQRGNGGWSKLLKYFAFCLDPLMVTSTGEEYTSTSPILNTEIRLMTSVVLSSQNNDDGI